MSINFKFVRLLLIDSSLDFKYNGWHPKKMLTTLRRESNKLSSKKRAKHNQRYFKTGDGQYGYGDVFIGLTVPQCRDLAGKYKDISFDDIGKLLRSEIHEERLIALLILVYQFENDELLERRIYEFYLKNTKFVNNWDLVDASAANIAGGYLIDKPKGILHELAKSNNIWERRISIIATHKFIKNGMVKEALEIAEELVQDENDLIQKALGWTLREVGKKNLKKEQKFLKKHYQKMGRTALRYAIEKFPESVRKAYLSGKI